MVKSRGELHKWVSLQRCRQCAEWWLVAEEIGHIDVLCLRRLTVEAVDRLLKEDIWASDFDKYTTLLRLGKEAGRIGGWFDVCDECYDHFVQHNRDRQAN